MRTLKIILVSVSILFLLAILGIGYIFFVRPMTLSVYTFSQRTGEDPNFIASILTKGDTEYISDASETPLVITNLWMDRNNMIGKTQDGLEVYRIPKQDPNDYLMVTTEMFPNLVFRNTNLPPVRLGSTHFDEIQLIETQRSSTRVLKSRDQGIITEVANIVSRGESASPVNDPPRSAQIRLVSDQLPGLAYVIDLHVDTEGNTFLVQRSAPDDWIPAGPLLSTWFLQGK